jgi:hypothetical protein
MVALAPSINRSIVAAVGASIHDPRIAPAHAVRPSSTVCDDPSTTATITPANIVQVSCWIRRLTARV